jgi:hypothetical protein
MIVYISWSCGAGIYPSELWINEIYTQLPLGGNAVQEVNKIAKIITGLYPRPEKIVFENRIGLMGKHEDRMLIEVLSKERCGRTLRYEWAESTWFIENVYKKFNAGIFVKNNPLVRASPPISLWKNLDRQRQMERIYSSTSNNARETFPGTKWQ